MSHRSTFRFTTNRMSTADDTPWETRGVCKDYDPDLHFPVGTSGPALIQTEQAKANCRRCPVTAECLQWALDAGIDDGVFGNTTPEERRAMNRRGLRVLAAA